MITHDDPPRPGPGRRCVGLVIAGVLVAAGCSGGDGGSDAGRPVLPDPSAEVTSTEAPVPTLAGGVELTPVDPVKVLVGDGLAFGRPLPSEQVAAEAFTADPEVASAMARRVHSLRDGRFVADAAVLTLDGAELFDQGVLDAFVRGVVASFGDGTEEAVELAGRTAFRSGDDGGTAIGFLEGNLLVVVRGADQHDVGVVVERQLAAIAAGATGAPEPMTPLVPIPIDAAFVAVPTVQFQPILPEEDTAPVPPSLPGATGLQGRYGVVAGERRTVVWAFSVDLATYPSAEALEPVIEALASARASGAAVESVEVIDRVVRRATAADGTASAHAFRHQGLVLLVEGADPAQVEAVVSAWISALR